MRCLGKKDILGSIPRAADRTDRGTALVVQTYHPHSLRLLAAPRSRPRPHLGRLFAEAKGGFIR